MEKQIFLLVYAKHGKIKVINSEAGILQHDELLEDDWLHTATIDPCIFLEFTHNKCKDIEKQIRSLSIE